jgi:hypothetical protein
MNVFRYGRGRFVHVCATFHYTAVSARVYRRYHGGHVAMRYVYCTTLTNSVALVRERTIPTEQTPLVGEVIANVCG